MILSIILDVVVRFVTSPCSRMVVSLDELLKFSLLNQFFYLFFQIATFVNVMAVILVKRKVFLQVMLLGGHA